MAQKHRGDIAPKRDGEIMDCKECGLLLKEVALLEALLKVKENENEELIKLLDGLRNEWRRILREVWSLQ